MRTKHVDEGLRADAAISIDHQVFLEQRHNSNHQSMPLHGSSQEVSASALQWTDEAKICACIFVMHNCVNFRCTNKVYTNKKLHASL